MADVRLCIIHDLDCNGSVYVHTESYSSVFIRESYNNIVKMFYSTSVNKGSCVKGRWLQMSTFR